LEVAGVFPEVVAVVLAALGGCAHVTHARLQEQLETPAVFDETPRSRTDRLAREHHAAVAGERVGEIDALARRELLEREDERTREVVPGRRAQFAAEPHELGYVRRL